MNSTEVDNLQTIRDYIRWAMTQFRQADLYYGHGTDNAWDEAVALVLHALHLPHDIEREMLGARLTSAEQQTVIGLVKRRVDERLPLPYLTHEAWFAGLPFYVDQRVIVPRSPFAELITHQFQPWVGQKPITDILDLCTGSGCMAIACAVLLDEVRVDAVDISSDALAVAARNVDQLAVADAVTLWQSDLFNALPEKRYDIIISNPPYVGAEEMATLPAEFRQEPQLALQSADEGLALTLDILRHAGRYLQDDGLLFVEVGNSQAALEERLPQVPFTWLQFDQGGSGVFLLTAAELRASLRYLSNEEG